MAIVIRCLAEKSAGPRTIIGSGKVITSRSRSIIFRLMARVTSVSIENIH
jgi:hypothetical protein